VTRSDALSGLAARTPYLILLALLVPLGLFTKRYTGPAAPWVADNLGGVLYVLFWILLALAAVPRLSPGRVALTVLAITCALELLQLSHPPWLQAIRGTFIGHALLGNTFAWLDFPHYVAGALLGWGIGRRLARRHH
jgi:hypothetical protein